MVNLVGARAVEQRRIWLEPHAGDVFVHTGEPEWSEDEECWESDDDDPLEITYACTELLFGISGNDLQDCEDNSELIEYDFTAYGLDELTLYRPPSEDGEEEKTPVAHVAEPHVGKPLTATLGKAKW